MSRRERAGRSTRGRAHGRGRRDDGRRAAARCGHGSAGTRRGSEETLGARRLGGSAQDGRAGRRREEPRRVGARRGERRRGRRVGAAGDDREPANALRGRARRDGGAAAVAEALAGVVALGRGPVVRRGRGVDAVPGLRRRPRPRRARAPPSPRARRASGRGAGRWAPPTPRSRAGRGGPSRRAGGRGGGGSRRGRYERRPRGLSDKRPGAGREFPDRPRGVTAERSATLVTACSEEQQVRRPAVGCR
jgi:hypothetical protein